MNPKTIPNRLTLTEGVPVTFEAPKGSDTRRRFDMLAYTGAAMSAPMIGRVIVDLDGLNAQGERKPILRQHDDNRIAGYSDKIEKTADGLRMSGVLTLRTESGREVAELADDGFPWQASVGIAINRLESVKSGDSVTVNGAEFAGPGVVIRASTLKESSFVPLGADGATSAVVFSDGAGTIEVPQEDNDMADITLESLKASAPAVYQAAFDEGRQAGITEATPKPATVNELKAAFPNDSGFVVDQLGAGATLDQAKAAFAEVATVKLADAAKQIDTLKAELAKHNTGQTAVGVTLAAPADGTVTDSADPKVLAAAEWDADPKVRAGFSSKDRYVSIRAAELSGAFRRIA